MFVRHLFMQYKSPVYAKNIIALNIMIGVVFSSIIWFLTFEDVKINFKSLPELGSKGQSQTIINYFPKSYF